MNITVEVQEFPDVKKIFGDFDLVLNAQKGQLYPRFTAQIQHSIEQNSDPSYTNSPAKELAKESANDWQHSDNHHEVQIVATDYANYRQYECGGIPQATLVDITDAETGIMQYIVIDEFEKVI